MRIATILSLIFTTLAMVSYARPKNASAPTGPQVTLIRTPDDGIQPQTVVDGRGVLHMIYFKGDPSAGDIEYVRQEPAAKTYSSPIRVNSQPGSAVAIGTVRGPQMALGRGGRAFVVWFGSAQSQPRGPGNSQPLLFSRLNDTGTAFEPERNLMQYATGINGGLSVAADRESNVYVMWHANGETLGEANRRVYLARSKDDGKIFARESPISPASLGACGCCGMRGFVDNRGTLYILYRAASENVHRDMTLLVSADRGRTFRAMRIAPWELNACPMSTNDLSEGVSWVLAAWETAGQVYFDQIDPRSFKLSFTFSAPGQADNRKHPAVSANSLGQTLLAWTEDTGWEKGGALAWQLYDQAGKPLGPEGHADAVPVWGLPSVVTNRQGNFTIFY